jgi:lysophospholipase L1-like esterase
MDPDVNSYPAQLQHQLDPALFDVQNFGHSGTGLVRPGRLYLNSPRHRAALDWQPDVVICNLGINDMTMGDALQREVFLKNYRSLIDAYADLPTAPVIVLWSPLSPVLPGLASYSQPLRQRAIEEWIQDVAARTGSLTLDMQAGLVDHPEWYPDRLHPNAEGARFIAEKTAAFLHNLSL